MAEGTVEGLARRLWAGDLGWYGHALSLLLAPAALLYGGGVGVRNRAFEAGLRPVHRAGVPVVSVGNLAVGGTGKTPVAAYVARVLREHGAEPALLHGGYAMDEPALHRAWAPDTPVFAGRDRVASAAQAVAHGARCLVLDDGFQHRRLHRDLDVVLLAAEQRRVAQRLLPRGPLREPPSALRRAGLLAVTRKSAADAEAAEYADVLARETGRPACTIHLAPAAWMHRDEPAAAPSAPATAVAGIAAPPLFAASAEAAGAQVARLLPWPDHHEYDFADAAAILDAAGQGAIVTTEKDWIKLRLLLPHDRVWVLRQAVHPEHNAAALAGALAAVAAAARSSGARPS